VPACKSDAAFYIWGHRTADCPADRSRNAPLAIGVIIGTNESFSSAYYRQDALGHDLLLDNAIDLPHKSSSCSAAAIYHSRAYHFASKSPHNAYNELFIVYEMILIAKLVL
jgi:hypothetical protein